MRKQSQENKLRDRLHRINNKTTYSAHLADARCVVSVAVRMAGDGVVAVGVSGGKDSVAMCHIVAQHCNPLLIYNDSGLELPESKGVVNQLADTLGLNVVVAGGDAIGMEIRGEDSDAAIEKPVLKALRENNVALEFVGLRSLESKKRRMLIGRHGPIHHSKRWGCMVAWPMRIWTAGDVFAYIDEHDLPLHPAYLRDSNIDRDSIRVSWAYDSDRIADGEVEILRRNYPDLYRFLRESGILDYAL